MSSGFGIFFVGCTCPIPHTAFAQTDSNHWVRAGSAIIILLLTITSIVLVLERESTVKRTSLCARRFWTPPA